MVVTVGSVVILLADLAFLYIWWQAFRRSEEPARREARMG